MKQTVFANLKGGTGKSSVANAVAYILAVSGRKVLAVDLNLQGDTTRTLLGSKLLKDNLEVTRDLSVYPLLVGSSIPSKEEVLSHIINTGHDNLDVMPATFDLWEADIQMYEEYESFKNPKHERLKNALSQVEGDYDNIIIDVNNYPSLVTLNGFVAADEVIAVVSPGAYERSGIELLERVIGKVKENHNSKLKLSHILWNKVEQHLVSHQETMKKLNEDTRYTHLVCDTIIRKNSDMMKAQEKDMTVMQYNRYSNSGKDLAAFVNEVFFV